MRPYSPYGFLADPKRLGCGKGWGSRKGWVYSAAMPPQKKRDAVAPNLGAKFGLGNGQKMREFLGFGGGTPNIYFLFILVVKIAPNRINDLGL